MQTEKKSDGVKVVATNRKARQEFFIVETFEAGIALKGTEVKSLRQGKASLQESYAAVKNGEAWVMGMHISPYEFSPIDAHEPTRDRKLLLHKKEIRRLVGRLSEKGLTLIPLRLYFKSGIAKVEIALARGKRAYDKREAIKQREVQRELRRQFAG
jgi:SsrA-binding protein